MKKATIIFSFILILALTSASYFLHRAYLKNYKKEFKSYISAHKKETNFTIINISSNELYINSNIITWEDENKEVVYKGILYDIVSVEKAGNLIILSVVSDTQETELKKQFASIYDVNSSSNTKNPFELLKNFFSLKSIVPKISFVFNNPHLNCVAPNTQLSFQITSVVILQETPPPDFCI